MTPRGRALGVQDPRLQRLAAKPLAYQPSGLTSASKRLLGAHPRKGMCSPESILEELPETCQAQLNARTPYAAYQVNGQPSMLEKPAGLSIENKQACDTVR
ncbi:hypothetical protein NDU88_005584 [Pleurodeles waltl]|uniref:Uncharacterized protein n=1 Tax=Pleurodeles waltl TaxID=8319 RepID=A0AAV7PIJ2_PLEWA|nr:hypothetical protein NDU88_005584 [Pleurodeles waltl]